MMQDVDWDAVFWLALDVFARLVWFALKVLIVIGLIKLFV